MFNWHWKKTGLLVGMMFALVLSGCAGIDDRTEKLADLEYTVLSPEEYPDELLSTLEEKKAESFRMTYTEEGYLFICLGYGMQETGGYSIAVDELYETANGVYVETTLIGPGPEDESSHTPSYPYIVLKLEDKGKSVIFG